MRIEQLQAFLALVETVNFQKAAQQCGLAQSTLSRQIQSLEGVLGLPLFHRSGTVRLTVGGEQFLPYARRIVREWSQAQEVLRDLQMGRQTELCIAAIHSVCAHHLPIVLEQFFHAYPQIKLRVTTLGSDRALKVLKDGLVDLAIVMDNPMFTANSEMVVQPLFRESIQVLMASKHPLSQFTTVPWAAITGYPQAIFKEGYGMRRLIQAHLANLGVDLPNMMELNALDAFRGVVRQGRFIALLPASALADMAHDPELQIRPLEPPILERQVVLVTSRDRYTLPPIASFFQLAHQLIPEGPEQTLALMS